MMELIIPKTPNKYIILDVTFDILPVVINLSLVMLVYIIYNCNNNNITFMLLND